MLALVAILLAQAPDAGEAEAPPAEATPAEKTPPAEEAPPAEEFAHKVDINGYVSSRTAYGRSRWSGLISTANSPQWLELLELNGQLKVTYHPRGFVYADLSAIAQLGFDYRSMAADGTEQYELSKDVIRPLISLNELYGLHEIAPWFNVMLGKKRITWGAGQAFNPTDLLNVRKDPTDPTFQRAGAWLIRAEVPLETSVFTLLFSPMVTEAAQGIPYGMLLYPSWDPRNDNQPHYLLAARAYFLVENTDINLMAYFSNRYLDEFENKVRFGASVSRIVFDTWEVHAEGLVQQGSTRTYVNHDCVTDVMAALACNSQGKVFAARDRLNDSRFYPELLAGVRKQFDDDSFLSFEYLYQGDGYRPDEFQDLISAFDGINQARAYGIPVPPSAALLFPTASNTTNDSATPSRYTFAPQNKHYAFITFNKPRIRDDFTFQMVLIANLQDLSTLWTPSFSWSATEWLTLSLTALVPVPGPNGLAAKVPSSGKYVSEYGAFLQLWRAYFELRVFY